MYPASIAKKKAAVRYFKSIACFDGLERRNRASSPAGWGSVVVSWVALVGDNQMEVS